ncbi:MAG: cache domain-containing protein [Candidatus Delongbacteria bacterium]|nr:cache domain-containing protein [Candidatus Delongbacteria bacterium]MBN2834466.1 cache domain-containing protein [Candidatus Delongbacteria bacterium]
MKKKSNVKRLIIPSFLAIAMFIIVIFNMIIPSFKNSILDKKREMIVELTNSAESILRKFYEFELDSSESRADAQLKAIKVIEKMRYGEDNKDYFWITDKHPKMIMHPYRDELDHHDLNEYKDLKGKRIFVDFVDIVNSNGHGFADYYWQWKDDSTRIVPKLSYVREFEPWGWIIGTGIYIEDVNAEIEMISNKMIKISIFIIVLITAILAYITKQNIDIDKKRRLIEQDLVNSKEKYFALAKASTEGSIMLLNGKFAYANSIILEKLGYTEEEFFDFHIFDLIIESDDYENFVSMIQGREYEPEFELKLLKKDSSILDVIINVSEIKLDDKSGFILLIRDFSSQVDKFFAESDELFSIFEAIGLGFLKGVIEDKLIKIEKSNKLENNIKYVKGDYFYIEDFLGNDEYEKFVEYVEQHHHSRALILKTDTDEKVVFYLTGNEKRKFVYIFFENNEKVFENNLDSFFMPDLTRWLSPVEKFQEDLQVLNWRQSVKSVLEENRNCKSFVYLIIDNHENPVGYISDQNLKYVKDMDDNISSIMSSPIFFYNENMSLLEAEYYMRINRADKLFFRDSNSNRFYMISVNSIYNFQQDSIFLIQNEISNSRSIFALKNVKSKIDGLISISLSTGVKPSIICKLLSFYSDEIIKRVIDLAILDMGSPPCEYSFVLLGSEGRSEETLITDQDNCIIFNSDNPEHLSYYLNLGKRICRWLDEIGYNYCQGGIMAQNSKWCQPINVWHSYFTQWISGAMPEDILDVNIFFDFRLIHGSSNIIDGLRNHIKNLINNHPEFILHFARNTQNYKIPIGFFGNFETKNQGSNKDVLNIKEAMLPLVNFARLYTLKYHFSSTNTLRRAEELYKANLLTKTTFDDFNFIYNYLMNIRFSHQVRQRSKLLKPDNLIDPKDFSEIEKDTVKKVFTGINNLQKKINFDFMGGSL